MPKYGSLKKFVTSSRYITEAVATMPITKTVSIRRRSPPITSAQSPPTTTARIRMPPVVIVGLPSQVFRSMATYCLSRVEIQNTGSDRHRNATKVIAVVEDAVLPQRGDDPGHHAHDDRQQGRDHHEPQGRADRRLQLRQDGSAVAVVAQACTGRRTARCTARHRPARAGSGSTPAGRGSGHGSAGRSWRPVADRGARTGRSADCRNRPPGSTSAPSRPAG